MSITVEGVRGSSSKTKGVDFNHILGKCWEVESMAAGAPVSTVRRGAATPTREVIVCLSGMYFQGFLFSSNSFIY
jgi:hypothetical protein